MLFVFVKVKLMLIYLFKAIFVCFISCANAMILYYISEYPGIHVLLLE